MVLNSIKTARTCQRGSFYPCHTAPFIPRLTEDPLSVGIVKFEGDKLFLYSTKTCQCKCFTFLPLPTSTSLYCKEMYSGEARIFSDL